MQGSQLAQPFMPRVLIIHSCPIYRRGLRSLLTPAEDIEIVGETFELEQILLLVHQRTPDVVLLDEGFASHLADFTAVQLVSYLRLGGTQGIFVLAASSTSMQEEHVFQLLKHGAVAYEPPHISEEDLLENIRRVARGECLITSSAFQNSVVLQEVPREAAVPVATEAAAADSEPRLSPTELLVLQQLMTGKTNIQIAQALGVSDQTTKNHITNIMKKFDVADRTAAVVYALRHGFMRLDDPEVVQVPRRQRSPSADRCTVAQPALVLAS